MARYSLYLDDERNPKTDRKFSICRTMDEARDMVVEYGFPEYISFDHDLGDGIPTGFDFAKWLVDHDLDTNTMPHNFTFNVHSANPSGVANIQGLLDHYMEYKTIG